MRGRLFAMQLVDTHSHIHQSLKDAAGRADNQGRRRYEKAGLPDPDEALKRAARDGVETVLCVGTTLADSQLAIDFAQDRPATWASIGIHPHEAKDHLALADQKRFMALAGQPKVVAIGECGLDYFYTHSPKDEQIELLHLQLGLAQKYKLPVIFHVREAFDDFWPIFDSYPGVRGVIHSFSATEKELAQILERGLYVGLNGIMTFTKNEDQLRAARAVPADRLVLETDAPFLTPAPNRNELCEPRHTRLTAEFLANLRGEPPENLAAATTKNAHQLFNLK